MTAIAATPTSIAQNSLVLANNRVSRQVRRSVPSMYLDRPMLVSFCVVLIEVLLCAGGVRYACPAGGEQQTEMPNVCHQPHEGVTTRQLGRQRRRSRSIRRLSERAGVRTREIRRCTRINAVSSPASVIPRAA